VLATKLCPAHQTDINPNSASQRTHRIDIKPSAPFPKVLFLGNEANITVAIFSEPNWDASTEIKVDATSLFQHPLTLTVESVRSNVKTNSNGSGTCSISDVADPITGLKDGLKDLKCQFPTSGFPLGTHIGIVKGFFLDPLTGQSTAFTARQDITIMP